MVLATFTVNSLLDANPPAGAMTLRQAIAAANADKNSNPQQPDVINITVSGTIALQSALPAITGSVDVEGPGASRLTIQGDGHNDAILSLASSASVTASGVTLDGDHYNSGVTVAAGATLAVDDDVVQHCSSSTNGAGILNDGGTVTVNDSTFSTNVTENAYGAGIANVGGTLTVSQSTFTMNFADYNGAGIYSVADSNGDGGTMTVLDSTFVGNEAERGGGVDLGPGATGTIVDSTFTANQGVFQGGAIALYGSSAAAPDISLTISGSTIVNNSGDITCGGIFVQPIAYVQPVLLYDSIIADNVLGAAPPAGSYSDVAGAISPASSFNLIGDGTGMTGLAASVNGNMIGTDANPLNPELGPLQNNGGPTLTMAPLPYSPAVDHGGPDPVGDDYTSTDQTGNPRIVAQPDSVFAVGGDGRDIGAVELPIQTPTVLTVNSTADAVPPAGVLTLRQAIEAADGTLPLASLPASQVKQGSPSVFDIDFSVVGTIALESALPTIGAGAAIALEGPGASRLAIEGDGLGDQILTVAPGASFTVASVTLTGPSTTQSGNASQNAGVSVGADAVVGIHDAVLEHLMADDSGGAILNQGGFVTLSASEIQNCEAVNYGGGIASLGGSLGVSQSLLTNNEVFLSGGGAIAIEDGPGTNSGAPGALTIVGSTLDGNTTLGSVGGGAVLLLAGTDARVTNSTFVGNSAGSAPGGAIDESRVVALTLEDSTLTDNSASSGGGIYSQTDTSPMTLVQNTIVAGNFAGGQSGAPSDISGAIETASANNIFGDGDDVIIPNPSGTDEIPLTNGFNGNLVGTAAQPINADLGPLQNNGGPTPTVALLPGSPAIGAGKNPLNGVYILTDQREYISAPGSPWDIGAYQLTAAGSITPALAASNVGFAAYSQTSYTFSVVYTDNIAGGLLGASNLTGLQVNVVPPGGGSPISATVVGSPTADGPTDPWGDASSFTITYKIIPPGGKWTSADNGTYSVAVNGTAITETVGNPGANGEVSTFEVATGSIGMTKYGVTHNIRAGTWSETVSLTNSGSSALIGPIFIVLALPPGVVLENATGTVDGMAFIKLNVASLAAGATTSLTLTFNTDVNPSSYSTSYFLGSLPA